MNHIADEVIRNQQSDGSFISYIRKNGKQTTDANSCITTLVLRELLKRPGLVPETNIENAIGFLNSCSSKQYPGSYNFYPTINTSQNLLNVPDDADDTAMISLLLLKMGRLSRQTIIRQTYTRLDKFRIVPSLHFNPPWIQSGGYFTWLDNGNGVNVVDCSVNANVVALYAYANLKHLRGYDDACNMIIKAVRWAGDCSSRLASLTPFYSHPKELYYAVSHAVSMGSDVLSGTLQDLKKIVTKNPDIDQERGIFCSAYGGITWHAPLLFQLRKLS